MPPHVTVLYPFLSRRAVDADVERALTSLVGGFSAFDFTLDALRTFPGVVYLAPRPAARFVALTTALLERWPDHPPYEGAYEDIVPHLTVAYGEEAPGGLAERLPLSARAGEVWLMARTGRRWHQRSVFPLGDDGQRLAT